MIGHRNVVVFEKMTIYFFGEVHLSRKEKAAIF